MNTIIYCHGESSDSGDSGDSDESNDFVDSGSTRPGEHNLLSIIMHG